MRRSRAIWTLLAASIAMLVCAGIVTVRTGSIPDPQVVPDLGFRVPVAAASSPETAVIGPSRSTFSPPVDPPQQVTIKKLELTSPIDAVGLDPTGAVEIPADISRIGWYSPGVAPGAPTGSAVLVGHRDGRGQGHGAFYDLSQLGIHDRIVVTTSQGKKLRYQVVARETIPKDKLPIEELFSTIGDARLTLISCAGYFNPDRGGYQANIVITAVPTAGSDASTS